LTVIVVVVLVVLGLRAISQKNIEQIDEQAAKTTLEQSKKSYTVEQGDSLWSIAQSKYKDGFKWTEIAKANSLNAPYILEIGQKLTIPVLEDTEVVQAPSEDKVDNNDQMISNKIIGEKYTVVVGDDLWDIAVRAYGDGFKWTEIAKANSLTNPNMIHKDNVLVLPR